MKFTTHILKISKFYIVFGENHVEFHTSPIRELLQVRGRWDLNLLVEGL